MPSVVAVRMEMEERGEIFDGSGEIGHCGVGLYFGSDFGKVSSRTIEKRLTVVRVQRSALNG